MPGAKAAELTPQQKAQTLTTEVLGIDTTKYEVQIENYERSAEMGYLSVVPQHIVAYTYTSNQDNFRLFYTFTNDNLQMIEIYNEGAIRERSNYFRDVVVVKEFLDKYQNYVGDSLYARLGSIIPVERVPGNSTVNSEDIALEIILTEDTTLFKWHYTANGAESSHTKFVSIIVERGNLKAFTNTWQLYPLGSTHVNVSIETAMATALKAANSYVWSLATDENSSLSAENFTEDSVRWEALIFMGSLYADNVRSEYPLELYPVWRFGIALDKWYGYMYGVQVDIWADTGEIRRVHEAWSSILPEEEAAYYAAMEAQNGAVEAGLSLSVLVVFSACVVMVSGFAFICMSGTKKLHYTNQLKRHGFKAGGVLFCLILFSSVFLGALETASATNRGAVIWGSESIGADTNGTSIYPNLRKSVAEINHQRSISGSIASYFTAGSYVGNSGINHQGSTGLGSSASQIKNDITTLYSTKDYVAVVDFNHGVGISNIAGFPPNEFHYMFEDNTGTMVGTAWPYVDHLENAVYDYEVYNLVTKSKTAFVFLNTCLSAETANQGYKMFQIPWYVGRAVTMPYAWTGRHVLSMDPNFDVSGSISDDGYATPDWGNQAYIGFKGGSASLEQPFNGNEGPYLYHNWLNSFMLNALTTSKSVNAALDAASLDIIGLDFAFIELREGFTPYWWNYNPNQPEGYLKVYGNGNICLKNFEVHTVGLPSLGGPTSGAVGASYSFTASSSVDSAGHRVRYVFDWADGTSTTTGYVNSGGSVSVSHTWSTNGVYGVKVYAQCENGCRSNLFGPYDVAIGVNPWLTVEAWDDYGYSLPVGVYVDGRFIDTAPVSLMVTAGSHSVAVDYQIYIFVIYDSFSDGGNNGDFRMITSDTTLTANFRRT